MNRALWKLFTIELRRMWTIAAVFVPLGLALLSMLILVLSARIRPVYDFARAAIEINVSLVVPFSAALLCAGIISVDVRDGWLRTLLIRPITRQQYLLIKLAAAFTSVAISVLIAGVLPNIITGLFFAEGKLQFDLVSNLLVHGLFLLQALLLVALLILFSCWLPGLFNIVLLTMWYIAASMVSSFLQTRYWSSQSLMFLRDFLFPDGFTGALDLIVGKIGTPVSELCWGFATLGFVLALAFWSVSRIQVDKSTE